MLHTSGIRKRRDSGSTSEDDGSPIKNREKRARGRDRGTALGLVSLGQSKRSTYGTWVGFQLPRLINYHHTSAIAFQNPSKNRQRRRRLRRQSEMRKSGKKTVIRDRDPEPESGTKAKIRTGKVKVRITIRSTLFIRFVYGFVNRQAPRWATMGSCVTISYHVCYAKLSPIVGSVTFPCYLATLQKHHPLTSDQDA